MSTAAGVLSERDHGPARVVASARSETLLARLGLGAIALHVLDDSFFQPQPGTSAGDHLVGGLVSSAVLLVVAASYPRLRPGLRASLAIVLGLFGLVAGIEAVYYLNAGRLSGDDYTGLLAIPAGLLLIGLGSVVLWRSRRGGSPIRRWGRRALLAAGAFIVGYVLLLPFLVPYALTHSARAFVPADHLGAAHENVSFETSDGLRLRGWYVPSKNRAAVIAFPGAQGSPRSPRGCSPATATASCSSTAAARAQSDGDPNACGWAAAPGPERRRRASSSAAPTSTATGSAASASPSAGETTAPDSRASQTVSGRSSSDGAGARSVREDLARAGSDKWGEIPTLRLARHRRNRRSSPTSTAPAEPRRASSRRIAPTAGALHLRRARTRPDERDLNPGLLRGRAGEPKAIWEVPGSGAHRRHRHATAAVRAARHRDSSTARSSGASDPSRPIGRCSE